MAIKYLITLKASFNLLIHSYLLSFHFPIDYILIDKSTFVTISDSWVKDQETHQEIQWVFISLWLLWTQYMSTGDCCWHLYGKYFGPKKSCINNFCFQHITPFSKYYNLAKRRKNCFCLFSWWLEPILHTCTCKLNNETQPCNKMCLVKLKTFQKREAVHVILKSSKQWVLETTTKQLL